MLPLSIDIKPGSTHYENNEKQIMFEFKKALWMLLLSTPILIGLNDLADSVSVYPDQASFYFPDETSPKQEYKEGTNTFH